MASSTIFRNGHERRPACAPHEYRRRCSRRCTANAAALGAAGEPRLPAENDLGKALQLALDGGTAQQLVPTRVLTHLTIPVIDHQSHPAPRHRHLPDDVLPSDSP